MNEDKYKILHSIFEKGREPSLLTTHTYLVHGLSLHVHSNSDFILRSIMDLLAYFYSSEVFPDAEIDFFLLQYPLSQFPKLSIIRNEAQLLYDSEKEGEWGLAQEMEISTQYLSRRDLYVADFKSKGTLLLDIFRGVGVGIFPDPSSIHPDILSNFIFLIGLTEIIRPRDLFLIHAAALAQDSKGLLIPGFSGSGKTTLSIALLREGFRFLSDDRPFFRKQGKGFQLLAFPEALDVTDKTLSFFPEIQRLSNGRFKQGLRKKKFWVENVYPNSIVSTCVPKVLIFPNIEEEKKSRLKPISKVEAVGKLLPHGLLVFDKEIAKKHFHLLCQLVEETDCYLLEFGKDLLNVHWLIEEVL